jgi:hypothetical protein
LAFRPAALSSGARSAAATVIARGIALFFILVIASVMATTAVARWRGGLLLAYALHQVLLGGFGRCCHDLAAWRLAAPAPNSLPAHGNRLGFFAGLGSVFRQVLARDFLAGEFFDFQQKAFFV